MALDGTLIFMAILLISMSGFIVLLVLMQEKKSHTATVTKKKAAASASTRPVTSLPSWLAWLDACFCPTGDLDELSTLPVAELAVKHQFSEFVFYYTIFWLSVFSAIVASGVYATFDAWSYMKVCGGLCIPLFVQPFYYPMDAEKHQRVFERYSFKTNVWIAIFSFIGNYWYTHYFYSVLGAKYTFAAHRLNDVPIAMFFATHFFFMTYHVLAQNMLHFIETKYLPCKRRHLLFWSTILTFSYFTAFAETLGISGFPCYSFQDRNKAYVLGSAFYGIYFIVSYPVFYWMKPSDSLYRYIFDALGSGMLVLIFLDAVRLYCGIPLQMTGVGFYISQNSCKF